MIGKYLPVDYQDTFCVEAEGNQLSPKEIISKIFGHNPAWLQALYKVRTCLVKPFGIETKPLDTENLIIEDTEQEAIMQKDDKHLLFYVDVFIEPISDDRQRIEITTLVKYHNWIGKAYFFCIKPFHRIIVPVVLKKVLKANK
ncbi:MAG: DUF2867 domain-containing protein [Bacteroides sp.]|nr:DUF2867 domain-containing protein [Bacteroides sp.]